MQDEIDMEEFHKTNDMALVTFLKLKGHAVQQMRWLGGTCYWFFRVSDGLIDMIDDFVEGRALVDPREYNRVFTLTKREFYDLKDQLNRR